MNRISPAWFLFLFAPITAEFLSGSSPSFNPILIAANLLLYGPGALMIRELKVRWRTGWLAVFILSIAYTVAEEGFMLNTLFDPAKNTSGRMLGVNWVWTAGMLMVHSLISIFLPIFFAETIYHQKVGVPWVQKKTFYLLLLIFAANVFGLGRLIAPANRPDAHYWLIQFCIIAASLLIASRLPSPKPAPVVGSIRSLRWFYLVSLAGTTVTFVAGFAAPALPIPILAKIAIMLGVYLAFLALLARNRVFNPLFPVRPKFAVACGIISFWILLAPLMSVAKGSPLPLLVAVPLVVFLFAMRRRLAEDPSESTQDPAAIKETPDEV